MQTQGSYHNDSENSSDLLPFMNTKAQFVALSEGSH